MHNWSSGEKKKKKKKERKILHFLPFFFLGDIVAFHQQRFSYCEERTDWEHRILFLMS